MASIDKDFKVKNGLIVGNSTNLVNYTSASPLNPFLGQLWISASSIYAWSSASTWVLVGNGNSGGGGSASGTPLNIANTLVARSASTQFSIGGINFDTTASINPSTARLYWSDGEGTLNIGLKGGNIDLAIGQEQLALCYNGTGSTLNIGDVVRIVGAQGQRPSIALASASNETGSSKTFGIVAEQILDQQEGFVSTSGIVTDVDTSAFSAGDVLWLSASAGKITNIMPTQPYHAVFIGYCLKSSITSGHIFIKIQNGYELDELHNVLITNASDNNILSYNQSASLWLNQNLVAAIQEVDGSGSGIDADLLDGQHASYFLPVSASSSFLTADTASAIYLRQDTASATYLRGSYQSASPTNPTIGFIWIDSDSNVDPTSFYLPISGGGPSTTYFEGSLDGGTI